MQPRLRSRRSEIFAQEPQRAIYDYALFALACVYLARHERMAKKRKAVRMSSCLLVRRRAYIVALFMPFPRHSSRALRYAYHCIYFRGDYALPAADIISAFSFDYDISFFLLRAYAASFISPFSLRRFSSSSSCAFRFHICAIYRRHRYFAYARPS